MKIEIKPAGDKGVIVSYTDKNGKPQNVIKRSIKDAQAFAEKLLNEEKKCQKQ